MGQGEAILRLKLSMVKGIGPRTIIQIIEKFGSVTNFFKNSCNGDVLRRVNKTMMQDLIKVCDEIDINEFLQGLVMKGIKYVVYGDDNYPISLSKIHAPPVVLYYKGNLDIANKGILLAVVGTRRSSTYGRNFTKHFVEEFVNKGISIVSGMAMGIDTVAHTAALAMHGDTIAVLGSSVDEPIPKVNKRLYNEIVDKGLILSEYPPGSEVLPINFPQRNRIIAGLSRGVVIAEASSKSGALITAQQAFEENRLVFALPADINRISYQGTNNLIKQNKAQLVTSPNDVLVELGIKSNMQDKKNALHKLVGFERDIVQSLLLEPLSDEQIHKLFDIAMADLLASLSVLELKGAIMKNEQGKFCVVL